jgi:uncharacterized protein YpuA (DUF1002 family)
VGSSLLLALEALSTVLALSAKAAESASKINDILQNAANEGRADLTEEEVQQVADARHAVEQHLLQTLDQQDAADEAGETGVA